MVIWIKRFAVIVGLAVFFSVFFFSIAGRDPFEASNFIPALVKAFCGASLFWFAGFILGDILFKGVLSDIDYDKANLLEGGLLQQITQKQGRAVPVTSKDLHMKNQEDKDDKKENKKNREE
jgi:hypothetical protein